MCSLQTHSDTHPPTTQTHHPTRKHTLIHSLALSLTHSILSNHNIFCILLSFLFLRINLQSGVPRSKDPMARKNNKGSWARAQFLAWANHGKEEIMWVIWEQLVSAKCNVIVMKGVICLHNNLIFVSSILLFDQSSTKSIYFGGRRRGWRW